MKPELRTNIVNRLAGVQGRTALYYKSMITGETLLSGDQQPYKAASIIKLPVLLQILKWAQAGQVDLAEKLWVKQTDKVPLSGALTLFTDELAVDVLTLCRLMISLSDNTATNVLIRRYGVAAYQAGFAEMGLVDTRLERCLFDEAAAAAGKQNVFSITEIGGLLEQLYRGEFVNEEVSRQAVSILRLQQVKSKLAGILGENAPIAHKTGEAEGITHDVGILFAKEPFVLCFAGNDCDVPAFEAHMRQIAWELYGEANREKE